MTMTREPGLRAEPGSAARPLLEREGELAALDAAIDAAQSGDGRVVVIEGAAGIGKTRLLTEARSLAAEFDVLTARAGELESDLAFGIVRQLFEPALAAAPAGDRDELLSGAAALAGSLFARTPNNANREGTETPFAILHGLYWLAANFALRRPTLLAVDDLHWTDEPSLRWLGYVARRLEGLPLLLVTATKRDHPSRQRRQRW
jgi:predicted ATPase